METAVSYFFIDSCEQNSINIKNKQKKQKSYTVDPLKLLVFICILNAILLLYKGPH